MTATEWLGDVDTLQGKINAVESNLPHQSISKVKAVLYDIYAFHEKSLSINQKFPLVFSCAGRRLERYISSEGQTILGRIDEFALNYNHPEHARKKRKEEAIENENNSDADADDEVSNL